MDEFGSISGLIEASEERLCNALRGERFFVTSLLAARKIVAAGIREAALETTLDPQSPDLHRYLFQNLAHRREEFLVGFFADDNGGFIAEAILAMGDGQGVGISARGVLQRTLTFGAGQLLLVHNHPSKTCSPSRKDIQETRKIRKMASTLGITLLDHLIVGGQRIYSICQGRVL